MDAAMRRSDIRCLTIRPSWVQWEGNYDQQPRPRRCATPRARRAPGFWAYIDVYDLADALRLAAESELDTHEVFYIASPDNHANRPLADLIRHHHGDADRDPRAPPPPRRLRPLDREGASACSATRRRRSWRDYLDRGRRAARRRPRAARARRHRRSARARGRLSAGRRDRRLAARRAGTRAGRPAPPRRRRPGRASRARSSPATSDSSLARCSVSSAVTACVALVDDPLDLLVDQPLGLLRGLGRRPGSSGPRASEGSTAIGPIARLIPQRPTIARAIPVSCSMSDSAPVVIVP